MKRFIVEVTVGITLTFLSGLILYLINIPSEIAKKINNIEVKLRIVNFGTSHGSDFDYSYCKLNGTSINRAGNTLYYDLQNYLFLEKKGYLSKDAIVIITVSYFVFGLDENRTDRLPDESFVNDFYYYLPKEQIFSYSKKKERSLRILRIQQNFRKLFANNEYIFKPMSESELENHSVSRVIQHKKLSSYSSMQKNFNYLETLIKEVIDNKQIPILLTTPYYYCYNENWGREWLDENYFNVMKGLSAKYNIPYLDYSHDNRLCFKADYFNNSDHLSIEGRKMFSSIVFSDIENRLEEMSNKVKR